MQRLLTFQDLVTAGYVHNRVTLSRRIRKGEFPAPIRVSSRSVAWLKSEVDAWEVARIASRDKQCISRASVLRPGSRDCAVGNKRDPSGVVPERCSA